MARLLSPHFSEDEFWCHGSDYGQCSCNHSLYVDQRLIDLLEQLRYNVGGYPLTVNSGYRCREYNRNLEGSATNSQHCRGTAADVALPVQLSKGEFLWYIEQLPFDGVGVYSNFIHLDVREDGTSYGPITSRYYWEGTY